LFICAKDLMFEANFRTPSKYRQRAEDELAALHRERELMRALKAERDPALPLQ
jgi:hypothetical protein